jgi:hypothetical protein
LQIDPDFFIIIEVPFLYKLTFAGMMSQIMEHPKIHLTNQGGVVRLSLLSLDRIKRKRRTGHFPPVRLILGSNIEIIYKKPGSPSRTRIPL